MKRRITIEVDDALLGQRMKVEGKSLIGSLVIDFLGPVIVEGQRARSAKEASEWGINLVSDVQL